jgi:ferritin-like metal-binding protein YciE
VYISNSTPLKRRIEEHLAETRRAIELFEQALGIGREISDPRIIRGCEEGLQQCRGDVAH